ncbi:serine protease inhibitor dipetalogastin-like isoform X2 [Arctopsyche grandis]|uniref:serine protease inhibitor dipetalogastin-like isoform X2 n=1 Tax=Arctopsyche grandis TaxID=121162 RepID=UPI00406D7FAF
MRADNLYFFFILGVAYLTRCSGQEFRPRRVDATIVIDNNGIAPPSDLVDPACKSALISRRGGQICAKNGVTYANMAYVKCLNRRLPYEKKIQINYRGSCTENFHEAPQCESNMLYEPVCGNDNQTYANVDALNCKNLMQPGYNVRIMRHGECGIEKCPCRGDLEKVCASNGITYRNAGEVRCLKKYNPDLRILHSGGCSVREVRRNLGRRMACHMSKNRFEWNPVCGESNITYANPYLYICHRPRNESKCAARPGECGTLQELACHNMIKINRNQLESTSLVCGSNKLTYRSYEHLHCASIYDRHLTAISVGKCGRGYDPCLLETKPLLDKGNPVCGSDGKTYISVEALWCVKHKMKKDLKYVHDGRCI